MIHKLFASFLHVYAGFMQTSMKAYHLSCDHYSAGQLLDTNLFQVINEDIYFFCPGGAGFPPKQHWAANRSWIPVMAEDAEVLPGKGVRCWVASSIASPSFRILLGTRHLLAEEGVKLPL